MLAIGVGCFWFTTALVRLSTPYTIAQHFADLRAALEALDNVSDVEIQKPSHYVMDTELDLSQADIRTSDEPLAVDGSIQFELYLPIRVQQNYGFERSLGVDRFRVLVTYQYHSPLTLVYFDAPDNEGFDDLDPSTAVVIVRRFLEEKFLNHQTVRFNSLGPSPFHADFFLRASDPVLEVMKRVAVCGLGERRDGA